MQPLAFSLKLQSMSDLGSVLTHTARLGGEVTYLEAEGGRVHLHVLAPQRCVHRFAPQLERIVGVISLRELPSREQPARRPVSVA
jgi:hypothetical protein